MIKDADLYSFRFEPALHLSSQTGRWNKTDTMPYGLTEPKKK